MWWLKARIAIHGWFQGSFSCSDHKHHSTITSIPCLQIVSLKVSCFTALVTSWVGSNAGDLVDGLCRCSTETDSVPLPVATLAMHLPANPNIMEVTLVAFRKGSSVSIYGCWSGRSCGSMNNNSLLLLGGVLGWLVLLVVPELPFVVSPSILLRGGCYSVMASPMVDELLCQLLGTIKGSWS